LRELSIDQSVWIGRTNPNGQEIIVQAGNHSFSYQLSIEKTKFKSNSSIETGNKDFKRDERRITENSKIPTNYFMAKPLDPIYGSNTNGVSI